SRNKSLLGNGSLVSTGLREKSEVSQGKRASGASHRCSDAFKWIKEMATCGTAFHFLRRFRRAIRHLSVREVGSDRLPESNTFSRLGDRVAPVGLHRLRVRPIHNSAQINIVAEIDGCDRLTFIGLDLLLVRFVDDAIGIYI